MSAALLKNFDLLAASVGGVAKLRELILSLAVRGRLAPQDPNDEPTSDLLKRIRAEKYRLIKEGNIKRDKPLTAITNDEKPYELPSGWEWVRLGDVIEIIRGITFPASEKTRESAPGRIACLRTANVQERIEWNDLLFVDRSFMGREEQVIAPHDIVMSMANSRELVGKVALIEDIPVPEATFGGFLSVLRPHLVLPKFAMIMLRTGDARGCLIDSSSQTTNIANISLAKLRPLLFPLAPLAEQSRIVAKVEELMALCDRLEAEQGHAARVQGHWVDAALDQLAESADADEFRRHWQHLAAHFDTLFTTPESIDRLDATLLELAVRGKLVPQDPNDEPASELLKQIRAEKDRLVKEGKIKRDKPLPPITDDEKPSELPRGWVWARFPELGEFGRGKSKHRPRNDPMLFNPGIYPLVQTGEVSRAHRVVREFHSKYSEIGLAQSKMWPAGTLCITIAANIAESAMLGFDSCFPDSVVGFVPAPAIGDASYFLSFIETARERLLEFAPATAQKNINLEILQSVLIPTPPVAEMRRIVAQVEELQSLTASLKARLIAAQTKQAHLAEALIAEVV